MQTPRQRLEAVQRAMMAVPIFVEPFATWGFASAEIARLAESA